MSDKAYSDQLSARAAYAARKEAARQTSSSGGDGSPSALEATLSRISKEVTAEAIERRQANGSPSDHPGRE